MGKAATKKSAGGLGRRIRWGAGVLLGLAGALVLGVGVLLQTPWGQDRVLRWILAAGNQALRGRMEVAGISSPGLLRGFTLQGVRIQDEEGRPFLEADSVRAALALAPLLRGELVLVGVELWRPRLTLEQLEADGELNAARIFGPRPGQEPGEAVPPPAGEEGRGWPRSLLLRRTRVHGGQVELLLPADRAPREASPGDTDPGAPGGGSPLRRFVFRDLDLELARAVLLSPEGTQRYEVRGLSVVGEVWPRPFEVRGLEGVLEIGQGGLLARISRLELPASRLQGRVTLGWGGEGEDQLEVQAEAEVLDPADLGFLDPRLPRGEVRGRFVFSRVGTESTLELEEAQAAVGGGRLETRGRVILAPAVRFGDLVLRAENLDLAVGDPWLARPLPVRGQLSGSLRLSGGLEALETRGNLSLREPGRRDPVGGAFAGTLYLGGSPGVRRFQATLAPFRWDLLRSVWPWFRLEGPGAVRLDAHGRLDSGLEMALDLTQALPEHSPNRVTVQGWIRQDGTGLSLDLGGSLRLLSLPAVRWGDPEIPLAGGLEGEIRLHGTEEALALEGRLETVGGPVELAARLNARALAEGYALAVEARDLALSRLLPDLPDPTLVSARLQAEGKGLRPDSLEARGTLILARGRVGRFSVDSSRLALRVEGGQVRLDTLQVRSPVGALAGAGHLPLGAAGPPGEVRLRLEIADLLPLRPLLMEVPALVYEDLSEFERNLLVLQGINPDTLTRAAEVALGGHGTVQLVVRGHPESLTGEIGFDLKGLRYRTHSLEGARGEGAFQWASRGEPSLRIRMVTDSLRIADRSFRDAALEVEFGPSGGNGALRLGRARGEEYLVRGGVSLREGGVGEGRLEELQFRFQDALWALDRPASFTWDPEAVRVEDFLLAEAGGGGMRIQVGGSFPLRGPGDLRLQAQGISLERLAVLAQTETEVRGRVDLDLHLVGPPADPVVEGSLQARSLRWGELALDSLSSRIRYRGLSLTGEVALVQGGRPVLEARGRYPADLRLEAPEGRSWTGPLDLTLVADSLPASLVLGSLEGVENLAGSLSGVVRVEGVPGELRPSGQVRLAGGGMELPDLGIRLSGVEARLGLRPDATVEVEAVLRSGGMAWVTGTLGLQPLLDPRLDLRIRADNFLAVNRPDVRARLSGNLSLLRNYTRPRVQGAVTVDQAVLVVEELARSAEVVDLSDPAYFAVMDTTLAALRPVVGALKASQNPFLQHLQLDVRAFLPRDTWLRGRDMNVELGGELSVFFDRTERELSMVGDLRAIRGVYSVFGRQFQVQEGTVSFQGTPGINPDLDIQALSRVRTALGERLDITASVKGPLLSPRVTLASNAPIPISESDLVSYLVFGRPTYQLGSGESSYVRAATEATANLALGLFSTELGSVFTRGLGLDYFAVTQEERATSLGPGSLAGTMAATRVELGQYLTPQLFAALTWRPMGGAGGEGSQVSSIRLEWRISDLWTLEGSWEDRYSRTSFFRVRDAARQEDRILRFFLYRDWGY